MHACRLATDNYKLRELEDACRLTTDNYKLRELTIYSRKPHPLCEGCGLRELLNS